MTEFFNNPNMPTHEESRRVEELRLQAEEERIRIEKHNSKAIELRAAVGFLAHELRSREINPSIILLEKQRAHPTGYFVRKITGRHWRYDEAETLGKGWLLSTQRRLYGGAQDGYAASMNGSGGSSERNIVLSEEGTLFVCHALDQDTVTVWGELDSVSFQLREHERRGPTYSNDELFRSVDLDEFERDLRSSGRSLLGYS